MDANQGFDPNRTVIGNVDPNRTQAIPAGSPGADLGRTQAVSVSASPLAVQVTSSRTATIANGPAREQFLLEIVAPTEGGLPGVAAGGPRTPLNLCLLIDRSGSMEGVPLDYAKQACSYVVDLLSPNDVLSIVVFDETVEVLMSPQRVTDRQAVKNGIAQIAPGYTTNLYDGMVLAAQQLASFSESGRATRMVVLTDGEPTAGIKDFSALVGHAGDTKARGISCTFLGFGPEYNEELLASMAKKAGGNYYYIPEPQLIPEIFRTELEKLFTVATTNVELELKLARWVNLRGATGHTVVPGEREIKLDLADLERGTTMQVVVDLEFPNHPLGHYRVAGGRLSYTEVNGGVTSVPIDLVMEFTADAARYSAPADPRVTAAAEISAASRAVERTILGLKTQQITTAAAISDLQRTQALLIQEGKVQEAKDVTMAMQAIQSGNLGGAEKTLMGTMVNLDQGKKST